MAKFFLVLLFIPIFAVVLVMSNRAITLPAHAAGASWDQLGNNVGGFNKFLGTKNSRDLVFKTNSIEAMSIDTNQSIFMGGASLGVGKLHVKSDDAHAILALSTDPTLGIGVNGIGSFIGVTGQSTSPGGVGLRGFSTLGPAVEAVGGCCDLLFRGVDGFNDNREVFNVKQDGSITMTKEGAGSLISGRRFDPGDPFSVIVNVFGVDTNGNVAASGTVDAANMRVGIDGYVQLDALPGAPPAADCGNQAFEGRMRFGPSPTTPFLYICNGLAGWVKVRLIP